MTLISPLEVISKHTNVNFYRSIAILNCNNTDSIILTYELLCHHATFFERKIIVVDFSHLFSLIKLHGIANRLGIDINEIKEKIILTATPTDLSHFEHVFSKVNELIDAYHGEVTLFWWFPLIFFKKIFKSLNLLSETITDFFSTVPLLTSNDRAILIILEDMIPSSPSSCSDPFDIANYVECTIRFMRRREILVNNELKITY